MGFLGTITSLIGGNTNPGGGDDLASLQEQFFQKIESVAESTEELTKIEEQLLQKYSQDHSSRAIGKLEEDIDKERDNLRRIEKDMSSLFPRIESAAERENSQAAVVWTSNNRGLAENAMQDTEALRKHLGRELKEGEALKESPERADELLSSLDNEAHQDMKAEKDLERLKKEWNHNYGRRNQ